ncbi:DinB family protein [Paenibacillus sp. JX-17]|uniref:DinB family protein n=1 Tax=Paenibacillus lacisoli TaxID=3064525 RepID=A0ABT9CFG0_9BACL|nr:DinB family protein [Paenibacillus sp. JX-17]MDO7908009.1 DinB family protein [Paenibacillus sp. JX-17]
MSQITIESFVYTYTQLREAVRDLGDAELKWKQSSEIWSIQEVLSHLVDHSLVISFRIRDILAGTQAVLPVFAQDAWVSGQYSNEGNANEILNAFRAILHYNRLLLERLNDEDLAKTGVNSKGERVSVSDIVAAFTRHVQNHLGQIQRIKQAAALV